MIFENSVQILSPPQSLSLKPNFSGLLQLFALHTIVDYFLIFLPMNINFSKAVNLIFICLIIPDLSIIFHIYRCLVSITLLNWVLHSALYMDAQWTFVNRNHCCRLSLILVMVKRKLMASKRQKTGIEEKRSLCRVTLQKPENTDAQHLENG